MTEKQRYVWSLYASGHRVTDIARLTGRSKGVVSTMIKKAKATMEQPPKKRESRPCVYSNSCFSCPLDDCVITPEEAANVNVI